MKIKGIGKSRRLGRIIRRGRLGKHVRSSEPFPSFIDSLFFSISPLTAYVLYGHLPLAEIPDLQARAMILRSRLRTYYRVYTKHLIRKHRIKVPSKPNV